MDLIENLDPEEARTLIDPALKLMMDAVHHYGGCDLRSPSMPAEASRVRRDGSECARDARR